MKRTAVLVVFLVAVLMGASSSWASSVVLFPDGVQSEVFTVPGGTAFVLFNNDGDADIFVHFADAFGNPLFTVFPGISGAPPAFAYWLQFTGGFDDAGQPIYNLWIDQGSGFFFVQEVVI